MDTKQKISRPGHRCALARPPQNRAQRPSLWSACAGDTAAARSVSGKSIGTNLALHLWERWDLLPWLCRVL